MFGNFNINDNMYLSILIKILNIYSNIVWFILIYLFTFGSVNTNSTYLWDKARQTNLLSILSLIFLGILPDIMGTLRKVSP